MSHIHVDLELYHSKILIVVFRPNPGNLNLEMQEGPGNEEIGFDILFVVEQREDSLED